MTEDSVQSVASKRGGLGTAEGDSEPSMLLQKLKSNISKNIQAKVDTILQDVQRFSDNAKLYLYLQLPSGPGSGEKSSNSDSSSWNSADQMHTCNWIRSRLEEHADTCLPKQDVYDTYKRFCDNLQYKPLSAANFGKIIPAVCTYCYSGIRRRTVLNMPLLPNLDLRNDPSELTELVQTHNQEVMEAACELICDWAQKILKRSFDTVVEIARFLVKEHIVNPRCSQAELISSATLTEGPVRSAKVPKKNQVEGGAEGEKDKEGGEQVSHSKAAQGEKPAKGAESSRSGDRDVQYEAVMKRYPQLLPRGSLCSSPTTLMPKDPAGVKVTLPITMTALPQQQGTTLPVINMISYVSYPEKEKAAALTVTTTAPTPGVSQRGRAAPKRTPELAIGDSAGAPPKRKRGRPRKPKPEETGQSLPPAAQALAPLSGGVIQKALPSTFTSPQPQAQTQPEVVKIVMQNQQSQFLGALPSTLEAPPIVDSVGLGTNTALGNETHSDSQPVQGASQNAVMVHAVGQPVTSEAQAWDTGRAMVEVIRRAPVSKEAVPTFVAPVLASSSQPMEKQGVGTSLPPAHCLTEPLLASASSHCPQPSDSSQA
ncbi:hypothetical protein GJAV_G00008580 [Gymnothorax javanicus]|nr:hypothetical protein GJAV_G00008580 [Gymnothorax javanicus]